MTKSARIDEFGNLLYAANRLEKLVDRELRDRAGISHVTFEVLLQLHNSPEQRLSQRELGERMLLTSGGITRLVDRLEQTGLVRRTNAPGDRRVTMVEPTEQGEATFDRAVEVHAAAVEEHFVAALPAERYAEFVRDLRLIAGEQGTPR